MPIKLHDEGCTFCHCKDEKVYTLFNLHLQKHSYQLSVVVDLLYNARPIICGSSVFVFVVLCISLCPF